MLQFLYYNFGGIAFFLSGYAIFSLFYGVFGWKWFFAKMAGDSVGLTLNFLIQHFVAFRKEAKKVSKKQQIERYVPLSIFNIFLDYAIVGGLKWLGVTPFIGMWISSLFFTVWNYFLYKFWVFHKERRAKKQSKRTIRPSRRKIDKSKNKR